MNIVKFKDLIMPGESELASIFNTYFKGRYCWAVRWNVAVPFDTCIEDPTQGLDVTQYIEAEMVGELPQGILQIDLTTDEIALYVDSTETINCNSTAVYENSNLAVPDEDITLDDLKNFRTYVAKWCLGWPTAAPTIDTEEMKKQLIEKYAGVNAPKVMLMLGYYAKEMFDEMMQMLLEVLPKTTIGTMASTSPCGCGGSSTSNNILMPVMCDAPAMYREAIYKIMTETFSDYKFWITVMSKTELNNIRRYIKYINLNQFPLKLKEGSAAYDDCTCLHESIGRELYEILTNAEKAFQYLIDDDYETHKNFIYNSLYAWASQLYEGMRW